MIGYLLAVTACALGALAVFALAGFILFASSEPFALRLVYVLLLGALGCLCLALGIEAKRVFLA